jgi:tungstate transport system substrate-binding protein
LEVRQAAVLTRDGEPAVSERHVHILEAVRDCGSLNAAAKHLRISFRDAWEKIRTAERRLGVALMIGRTGGARGGGSRLTPAAEDLIARMRAFHAEHGAAAARAAATHFGAATLAAAPARAPRDVVRLATTTSAVDTGVLAHLLPPFTRRFGIAVDVRPVGSGTALDLARGGRVDAVLTHAPEAEAHALQRGFVVNERDVMRNAFVIVGPPADPAAVRRAKSGPEALQRIAAARATLLSRGDYSGTHQRERALLKLANLRPGAWVRVAHLGMGELLRSASQRGAYALSDRGTMAALRPALDLDVLFEDRSALENTYVISATEPQRHATNYLDAMALIAWLTSPIAQEMITSYRVAGHPVVQPIGR